MKFLAVLLSILFLSCGEEKIKTEDKSDYVGIANNLADSINTEAKKYSLYCDRLIGDLNTKPNELQQIVHNYADSFYIYRENLNRINEQLNLLFQQNKLTETEVNQLLAKIDLGKLGTQLEQIDMLSLFE
jgi:uncharacterized coiled-coil DUF342 family protein